jgi:hypothetical protein
MHYSHKYTVKGKKYHYYCALKKMPLKIQKRTIKMISEGRSGMQDELIKLLLTWMNKVSLMPKELRSKWEHKLIHDTIKVMEAVHGKKEDLTVKSEGTLTIKDFIKAYQEQDK